MTDAASRRVAEVASARLPALVADARARASAAGFELSSEDEVGRLLAVLAAAVPPDGRILELGTGTGVGLAWLVEGLGGRADVELVSVEKNPAIAALAAACEWPPFVRLYARDALELLEELGTFDLIFADAEGGKVEGLVRTLHALRPHGLLVVDDMAPRLNDAYHDEIWPLLESVRETLVSHPDLLAVEIGWATGVIICSKRA